jgi:hypothetical protein
MEEVKPGAAATQISSDVPPQILAGIWRVAVKLKADL